MTTGIRLFYCSECGKRFLSVACEWCATAFVAPVKCPQCGSWHTRLWSLLPAKVADREYKKIWEVIDQQK